jgi:putative tryptophan/tyrosine transport system substrate-binding protein
MKMYRFALMIVPVIATVFMVHAGTAASKVYHVGVLSPGGIQVISDTGRLGTGLIHGFERRGYTIGGNLTFERRAAEWHVERLPQLADELGASKVDVIVTASFPAALAAKQRATTIPVVAMTAGDPVATGLVDSLARPGGNLTGLSDVATELSAKRLELLKEIVPQLHNVAILWNANDLGSRRRTQSEPALPLS